MLMGLYMSPWKEASAPIQALWQFQDFPPLFPLILAITGAVHNINIAHIMTLLFLIVSLPLIYLFSRKCFASNWQALAITSIFLLSPSTWLNILGILSENLYIFISLLIIVLFPNQNKSNIYYSLFLGLLISLLILTRTIGASMFLAYLIVGFAAWHNKSLSTEKFIAPIIVTILINLFAKVLHQSSVPSQYIQQLSTIDISGQPKVLVETWFAAWQYYWIDDLIIPQLFVFFLGVLACLGLAIRLRLLKLDAFYLLVYFCILLVWPHPGQALRFIYPVHALLIIYAFFSIHLIFTNLTSIKSEKPILIMLLISFSVIGPTLSYLWNRHQIGNEKGYNHIHEYYRLPEIKHAEVVAAIQKTMFNDMKAIESNTNENDTVLHFAPVYIALLANRHSKPLSFNYPGDDLYKINDVNDAEYIYVSKLHPRRTGKDINGLDLKVYFNGATEPVWTHYSTESGEPVSVLLKVKK
tara:strand:+ start:5155 stop:6561 length:1407 start_codon:yes stop_codon:yes gene_type:complete